MNEPETESNNKGASPPASYDYRSACSNVNKHTKQPSGYLEWHEWAEKKSKTHKQIKCPGCGRLEIWIPEENSEGFADSHCSVWWTWRPDGRFWGQPCCGLIDQVAVPRGGAHGGWTYEHRRDIVEGKPWLPVSIAECYNSDFGSIPQPNNQETDE